MQIGLKVADEGGIFSNCNVGVEFLLWGIQAWIWPTSYCLNDGCGIKYIVILFSLEEPHFQPKFANIVDTKVKHDSV